MHTKVGETEGKLLLRTHSRRKWENNIKMDLNETECESFGLIHLTHDSVLWQTFVHTVMNEPSGSIKGAIFTDQLSDSQFPNNDSAICDDKN
jgi:hypothetical protein